MSNKISNDKVNKKRFDFEERTAKFGEDMNDFKNGVLYYKPQNTPVFVALHLGRRKTRKN